MRPSILRANGATVEIELGVNWGSLREPPDHADEVIASARASPIP
jgi:hypothetical protein